MNSFEPDSDSRINAYINFNIYQAHVQAGFTPEQAMQILLIMIHTVMTANILKGDQ